MSIIKYTPNSWDPFSEMEEIMNRLPALRSYSGLANQQGDGFIPAVDIYETKTDVIVEAPLAGIDPKDVEVSVENGILSIKGEHNKEREVEDKNYYRKEVRSGSFYRKVQLPTAVKEDKISASFEDGLLRINAPKITPTKGKKVAVRVVKKDKK